MEVTVLIDNISNNSLISEWGLSFHIEYNGKRYLLDTGQSDAFIHNARQCGIGLEDVDCAVISHAHYDHSNGIASFLTMNDKASVHISENAAENCYAGFYFINRYIGVPKGVLERYSFRIVRHTGVSQIDEGVFLVSHSTPGLKSLGFRNHLFVKRGSRYSPDDFSHEQSLVFKTDSGLVIFNSCSHSGAEVVIDEVLAAFPQERVSYYFGGLHLFRFSDLRVKKIATELSKCKVANFYTGHCTGQKAFDMLKNVLGDRVNQLYCGMKVSI